MMSFEVRNMIHVFMYGLYAALPSLWGLMIGAAVGISNLRAPVLCALVLIAGTTEQTEQRYT